MWGQGSKGEQDREQGSETGNEREQGSETGNEREWGSKTGSESEREQGGARGFETYVILGFRVPTTCDKKV